MTWADVAPQETVDRVIQAHYDGSWGKYEANGEPPSYDVCWHDHDRDSRTEEVYLRHGLCTGGWVSSVAWDPADFDY